MPYSPETIRGLIRQFPDADDKTIALFAKAKQALGDAWDWGNKPLVGTGWSDSIQNPLGKFGAQMAEGLTSPLGLASLVLSGGAAAAGKAGLLGLSRAGLVAEGALNAPTVAHGAYKAVTGGSGGEKAAGALEAGLGAFGAGRAVKMLREAKLAKQAIPETMRIFRDPEYAGSSVHPTKGSMIGQDVWMTGGAVPQRILPEGQGLSEDILNDFVNKNARGFKKDRVLGTWRNSDNNRIYVDVADPVKKLEDAQKLGIRRGELALFNTGTFNEHDLTALPPAIRELLSGARPSRMLADRTAVSGGPLASKLAMDEAGKLDLTGFGPAARAIIDEAQAMREAAGPHGNMYPKIDNIAKAIREGDIGTVKADGPLVKLPENIPGVKLNDRRPLNQVVQIGPRKGAVLSPFAQDRLDRISAYTDANLDPASFDWTDPQWMSLFNSTDDAKRFARVFGAVSPRVELRPNFRDAMSITLQGRMGISPESALTPFGRTSTGFNIGLPKTKVPNLKRAVADLETPISSALPAKTNHLTDGMLGNPDAYPWDMHISRAKGVDSDAPGSPIQYLLTQLAYKDYAKSRGMQTFPNMAKNWSGIKHATAFPDTGFVSIANRVAKAEPDFLKSFTPQNEQQFFEAMNRINEVLNLPRKKLDFLQPSLF